MKRLFYLWFTDNVIANMIKVYCWVIGVRKGKRLIIYHSGYTNKDGGGIVCWSEIKSFNWAWVTYTKFSFSVDIHLYNHNEDFAKSIGAESIYIEKEQYNSGSYKIKDVRNYLKAQPMLKKNFSSLINPQHA